MFRRSIFDQFLANSKGCNSQTQTSHISPQLHIVLLAISNIFHFQHQKDAFFDNDPFIDDFQISFSQFGGNVERGSEEILAGE